MIGQVVFEISCLVNVTLCFYILYIYIFIILCLQNYMFNTSKKNEKIDCENITLKLKQHNDSFFMILQVLKIIVWWSRIVPIINRINLFLPVLFLYSILFYLEGQQIIRRNNHTILNIYFKNKYMRQWKKILSDSPNRKTLS